MTEITDILTKIKFLTEWNYNKLFRKFRYNNNNITWNFLHYAIMFYHVSNNFCHRLHIPGTYISTN